MKLLSFCAGAEALLIAAVAAACRFDGPLFYLFYNGVYGLALSLALPLLVLARDGQGLAATGLRRPGRRQWTVLAVFALFSVGGQLLPGMAAGETIPWELLPKGVLPLVMTTFFEEFYFRGFLQPRLEARFGAAAAVLGSGLLFSLYHLGYPGFRTLGDLALLWAVGAGFALAFHLSGGSLFTAYFVNLPNALITYVRKYPQFPRMTPASSVYAAVTLVLTGAALYRFHRKGGPRHG